MRIVRGSEVDMKLNDKQYQWIYDNIDRLKQALVTADFCREWRLSGIDSKAYRLADEQIHDLAFSFLMVAMGEHIPKTLWSVNDYSILYGIIDDAKDENDLRITDDE